MCKIHFGSYILGDPEQERCCREDRARFYCFLAPHEETAGASPLASWPDPATAAASRVQSEQPTLQAGRRLDSSPHARTVMYNFIINFNN